MGKGSQSTTTSQSPPANIQTAYDNLLSNASNVLQTDPYQNYTGQLVAPLSSGQTTAGGIISNEATNPAYQPYINEAQGAFDSAQTPLWSNVQQFSPSTVNQYMSPYTTDVTQATQAQFANLNAQQQNSLSGNAIAQGAFGGDRASVAQGILAGQQTAQEAPTLAGVEQTGYQTGLGEFNTEQSSQLGANEANAWLSSQAGFGEANLGQEDTNLGESTASSLLGYGGLQQQEAQENLNVPYYQFEAQQAAPYQEENWLAGITEGIGSLEGGNASTTEAAPSTGSQVAGGVMDAASLALMISLMKRGGRLPHGVHVPRGILPLRRPGGGSISNNSPFSADVPMGGDVTVPMGGNGQVPTGLDYLSDVSVGSGAMGPGPPRPPSISNGGNQSGSNTNQMMQLAMLAKRGQGIGPPAAPGSDLSDASINAGALTDMGDEGLAFQGTGAADAFMSGEIPMRRGGIIAHRDDGGALSDYEMGLPPSVDDDGQGRGILPPPPAPGDGSASGILPSDRYAVDYQPRTDTYQPDKGQDLRMGLASVLANMGAQAVARRPNYGAAIAAAMPGIAAQQRFEQEQKEKQLEQADTGAYRKADLKMHANEALDRAQEAATRLKQEATRDQNQATYQQGELGLRGQQVQNEQTYQRGELGMRGRQLDLEEQNQGALRDQAAAKLKMEQGESSFQSGMGPDDKDPTKQVPGAWETPKYGGQPKFHPGVTLGGKETGDSEARITGDINSQFNTLREYYAARNQQTGQAMPSTDDMWKEAEGHVRSTYRQGATAPQSQGQGTPPAALPPVDQRQVGKTTWKAPSGANYLWTEHGWSEQ